MTRVFGQYATIDPTGLARDQLIFTQDTDFATLTFDSFDLETQDAQGALVVTDILDLVTAALGQQDELDANGDPTGSLLPLGTYQYTWHAHGVNATIVGDCDSPFVP